MMKTPRELQAWLKITEPTLYSLIKKGLPVVKVGQQNRFIEADVLEWLKNDQPVVPTRWSKEQEGKK